MKLLNKINNVSSLKSYKKGETIFYPGMKPMGFITLIPERLEHIKRILVEKK
ncbi:MAG: hypothetical protein KAR07_03455 [Spirochaetes bacterium]|nr:hypothetical protein [Spirochaetota bacterium]